jgi:hypothetical protein
MNKRLLLAALASLTLGSARADYRIDHMEPPSWWTGMHERSLQLMVHGPQISQLLPTLRYPGVQIASVERVANPNYLFIDLRISAQARAGELDLTFRARAEQRAARRQCCTTAILCRRACRVRPSVRALAVPTPSIRSCRTVLPMAIPPTTTRRTCANRRSARRLRPPWRRSARH